MKAHLARIGVALFTVAFGALTTCPAAFAQDDGVGMELMFSYGTVRERVPPSGPFAEGLRAVGYRDIRLEGQPATPRDFGVNAAGSLSRYLVVFNELLYSDAGESRLSGRFGFLPRASFGVRVRSFEWTSGARVQFPVGTWRVRPYAGGGAGVAWSKIRGSGRSGDVAVANSLTAHDLTYHLDAGARVFFTKVFGVAPEVRLVNIPDDRFYRVLVSGVIRFR